ncbi:MAG: hypothetical protein ACMG6E_02165 [Candidatus Roizmanbacteria bacterium]
MIEIFGLIIQYVYYFAVILFVLKEFNVPYIRNIGRRRGNKAKSTENEPAPGGVAMGDLGNMFKAVMENVGQAMAKQGGGIPVSAEDEDTAVELLETITPKKRKKVIRSSKTSDTLTTPVTPDLKFAPAPEEDFASTAELDEALDD